MTLDQYIYQNNIRKADAIKVGKSWGVLTHYVIYLGRESEYQNLGFSDGYYNYGRNRHLFIANMLGGVKVLTEEDVLKHLETYQPSGINRFIGGVRDRNVAINRAFSQLNVSNYHLILNNCEHFASFVQTGAATSKQSNVGITAGIALLIGLGIALLSNNDDDEYN